MRPSNASVTVEHRAHLPGRPEGGPGRAGWHALQHPQPHRRQRRQRQQDVTLNLSSEAAERHLEAARERQRRRRHRLHQQLERHVLIARREQRACTTTPAWPGSFLHCSDASPRGRAAGAAPHQLPASPPCDPGRPPSSVRVSRFAKVSGTSVARSLAFGPVAMPPCPTSVASNRCCACKQPGGKRKCAPRSRLTTHSSGVHREQALSTHECACCRHAVGARNRIGHGCRPGRDGWPAVGRRTTASS